MGIHHGAPPAPTSIASQSIESAMSSSQSNNPAPTPAAAQTQRHMISSTVPAAVAQSNPLAEEASRLFYCATSSDIHSPSPTRFKTCRYPLRFSKYNHGALIHAVMSLACLFLMMCPSSVSAEDDGFTGQWNGEWTAQTNNGGDDDAVIDENREYSMWKDEGEGMTEDEIIRYATIAILSTLTLLFCLCHPEIPTVLCLKLKECFCGCLIDKKGENKGSRKKHADSNLSTDYVGGIQMEKRQDGESERSDIV